MFIAVRTVVKQRSNASTHRQNDWCMYHISVVI